VTCDSAFNTQSSVSCYNSGTQGTLRRHNWQLVTAQTHHFNACSHTVMQPPSELYSKSKRAKYFQWAQERKMTRPYKARIQNCLWQVTDMSIKRMQVPRHKAIAYRSPAQFLGYQVRLAGSLPQCSSALTEVTSDRNLCLHPTCEISLATKSDCSLPIYKSHVKSPWPPSQTVLCLLTSRLCNLLGHQVGLFFAY